MTEYNLEYFRKRFPHLVEEMEDKTNALSLDAVRTDPEEADRVSSPDRAIEPTAVDFIRLCDEDEEAVEIIDFLERQGRLKPEYAKRLRRQLVERGLRSFGPKREPGSIE